MDRPIWQILFAISFAGSVVAGAGIGWVLHPEGGGAYLLSLYAMQGVAALGTALGALLDRRWAFHAAIATGAFFAASSLLRLIAAGAFLAGFGSLLIIIAASAGIAWMLRG